MIIDANELPGRQAYRLLIDCVVPRPIAWISTIDAEGRVNLAPFSFNYILWHSTLLCDFGASTMLARQMFRIRCD